MKYLSDFISHLRPVRILSAIVLFVAITLTTVSTTFAAKSMPNKDMVKLDEITRKSDSKVNTLAMETNSIKKTPEGELNQIHGKADRAKMFSSRQTKVKQSGGLKGNIGWLTF